MIMVKRAADIRIKRVYDPPDDADGTRVLVDRLWSRGRSSRSSRSSGRRPRRPRRSRFAVGIVVFSEDVEGANLLEERATLIDRQGLDAGGDHDDAADEGAAKGVVEGADAFGGGHSGAGHWLDLLRLGLGMARAWFKGMRGTKRGDPKAAPCEESDDCCGGLIRPRYLPVTRNSGCAMATFFAAHLDGGYSGASNHSRVNSPFSIRLTVASQKPSNSRFSFQ
jgi:hypothetical protein